MQALVTVFRDLCCPMTSNGVGVIPLIVLRTRYPIQTLSDSTRAPLHTRKTVFPPVIGLKKALTVLGLLGMGTWAPAPGASIQEDSSTRSSTPEPLAEKGIKNPFVRKSAPASEFSQNLANW